MIPIFNTLGFLPEGIHWADLDEIRSRFGNNSHRLHLVSGLERAVRMLKTAGCSSIWVDGSFVTTKEFPNDYDACWDMQGINLPLLDHVFLDFSNIRAAQKAKYFGEFFPSHANANPGSPSQAFLQFFQTDKATGDKKGIVGINLRNVI